MAWRIPADRGGGEAGSERQTRSSLCMLAVRGPGRLPDRRMHEHSCNDALFARSSDRPPPRTCEGEGGGGDGGRRRQRPPPAAFHGRARGRGREGAMRVGRAGEGRGGRGQCGNEMGRTLPSSPCLAHTFCRPILDGCDEEASQYIPVLALAHGRCHAHRDLGDHPRRRRGGGGGRSMAPQPPPTSPSGASGGQTIDNYTRAGTIPCLSPRRDRGCSRELCRLWEQSHHQVSLRGM